MSDQKLADYIKNSLARGKSKDEVYKELLNQGWSSDVIQENLDAVVSEGKKGDTPRRIIWIIVTIAAILVGAGILLITSGIDYYYLLYILLRLVWPMIIIGGSIVIIIGLIVFFIARLVRRRKK